MYCTMYRLYYVLSIHTVLLDSDPTRMERCDNQKTPSDGEVSGGAASKLAKIRVGREYVSVKF